MTSFPLFQVGLYFSVIAKGGIVNVEGFLVQWLELFEEGANSMILWSDDPSGGRRVGFDNTSISW
jgi:hypothetical protein